MNKMGALDVTILVVLLVLLGGCMYLMTLVRKLDQTTVAKYCDKPPSYAIAQGSISASFPSPLNTLLTIPTADVQISFVPRC